MGAGKTTVGKILADQLECSLLMPIKKLNVLQDVQSQISSRDMVRKSSEKVKNGLFQEY